MTASAVQPTSPVVKRRSLPGVPERKPKAVRKERELAEIPEDDDISLVSEETSDVSVQFNYKFSTGLLNENNLPMV